MHYSTEASYENQKIENWVEPVNRKNGYYRQSLALPTQLPADADFPSCTGILCFTWGNGANSRSE